MFDFASKYFHVETIHRCFEKGHTQNEWISMHAVIENAKKGNRLFMCQNVDNGVNEMFQKDF